MRERTRDAEFSDYVAGQRVRLVRAARLLTAGDEAAAEDLVQTTLTRLYVHWAKVSRADDPVAYGYRSLTNAFLDERRRAHRWREVAGDLTSDGAEVTADPDTRRLVLEALQQLASDSARSWYCGTSCSTTSPPPPRPSAAPKAP